MAKSSKAVALATSAPITPPASGKGSKHSTIGVGGSTAGRTMSCPASLPTLLALPETVEVTSEYAEFGTHCHHIMDFLMRRRQEAEADHVIDSKGRKKKKKPTMIDLYILASTQVGNHFYDRVFTRDTLETCIEPALDKVFELEKIYGGRFKVAAVELSAQFPGIPGAFGTCDIILVSPRFIILADYKFGSGVGVQISYNVDGDDEILNAQIGFYATATLNTRPELFGNRNIVGAIIQPRGGEDLQLTHTEISREELKMFAEDLQGAVVEAMSRNPRRVRGDHCRFAQCKVICPLWTGPLLDLSAIGVVKPGQQDHLQTHATAYGEYLAKAKYLLDLLLVLKPTIDEQMHSFMENGGIIPGWKLKQKSKNRAWVAEEVVVPQLKKLGFGDSDIWQKKLVTFTSADATAKRLGVTIPENLRVAPPTTETTIAAADDPAPQVDRAAAVRNFSETLKQLKASAALALAPK